MEQLLETSDLKTGMCHRLVIKIKFINQSSLQKPQYALLLNNVFIFSVLLLYLTKYFYKHEAFLEYIVANMKV